MNERSSRLRQAAADGERGPLHPVRPSHGAPEAGVRLGTRCAASTRGGPALAAPGGAASPGDALSCEWTWGRTVAGCATRALGGPGWGPPRAWCVVGRRPGRGRAQGRRARRGARYWCIGAGEPGRCRRFSTSSTPWTGAPSRPARRSGRAAAPRRAAARRRSGRSRSPCPSVRRRRGRSPSRPCAPEWHRRSPSEPRAGAAASATRRTHRRGPRGPSGRLLTARRKNARTRSRNMFRRRASAKKPTRGGQPDPHGKALHVRRPPSSVHVEARSRGKRASGPPGYGRSRSAERLRAQRVRGKPRSTFEVAGSGQRDVTTLPRV